MIFPYLKSRLFSSAEWFGTEFASIFVPRNGITSCFLFRWRVRNGIRRKCFYFCSTEQNSELFSLPRKDSERNSEGFLFRGTAGIPSEITICFVCRKLPTLSVGWMGRRRIRLFWRTMEWRGRSPSALEIGIALIFLRTSSQLKRYGEKGQRSSLNNLTVRARNKWRGSRWLSYS